MRKIFYAAILILFCAIDAHAQGGAFGDVVFGPNIAIKPGASVTICSHPSTVASCPANKITLYSDINLSTPVTNPLTTDGEGHWLAYAPSGTYDYIVTGTGITPMTVPFTFSIGGSGSGPILQTNGTPNTNQALLNLHAGTNITLVNSAGTTTVNATGGGTGCTLPGNDTGVLSEHPINTCYDSADFTWDDTNTNLQAGDGTNTNTGALQSFIFGPSNDTTNCVTCLAAGDSNDITFDVAGTTGAQHESTAVGTANTIIGSNDGNNKFLGEFGGDNDLEYCQYFYLMGNGNSADGVAHNYYCQIGMIAGQDNALNVAGGSSESMAEEVGIFGNENEITQATNHPVNSNYIYGDNNRVTTLNGLSSTGVRIYGYDNQADGTSTIAGATDITMFGNSNIATNLVVNYPTYGGANDNTLVGSEITMDNVGYGFVAGMIDTLHDCLNCETVGYNNNFSTSNALSLGMGGNEEVITPGLVTLNASQAVTIANAASTGTTLHKLAKFTGAPATAVITATSDTSGAIGIVSAGAGTTGSASVSKTGITLCVFDGATTSGDYVNISSSTAGDCHDAGSGQPLYSIGRVTSTNGGGGTYAVDLQIGAGTGGAIATQGKVALTGQTTSLSPTALLTTPASPSIGAYRVTTALSCDSSSASATVTFTLAWTDPSSTSQSITSSAATCTTLGSASYQSLSYAINVAEGTAINYSTTIANTPTYSLHVLLEGAW